MKIVSQPEIAAMPWESAESACPNCATRVVYSESDVVYTPHAVDHPAHVQSESFMWECPTCSARVHASGVPKFVLQRIRDGRAFRVGTHKEWALRETCRWIRGDDEMTR